jgi:hypothetical protein
MYVNDMQLNGEELSVASTFMLVGRVLRILHTPMISQSPDIECLRSVCPIKSCSISPFSDVLEHLPRFSRSHWPMENHFEVELRLVGYVRQTIALSISFFLRSVFCIPCVLINSSAKPATSWSAVVYPVPIYVPSSY